MGDRAPKSRGAAYARRGCPTLAKTAGTDKSGAMEPDLATPGAAPDLQPEFDPRDIRALLIIGAVFALVGGYADAYSYLAHGGVFANAQTGNVVLLAVYASAGAWDRAVRHIPPILAFALGVAAAKLLGVQSRKRLFRATLICQGLELAIVCVLAAIGRDLPDGVVVPALSFVAAIQHTSLDRVGPWPFNSAMTTGNLRDAAGGVALWLAGRDPARNRRRALALGAICGAFAAGALLGAVVTRAAPALALWPCALLVLTGLALTWRERRRNLRKP
jgi:uncharacterized membrane protein YoaK (UPF0700 family)